MMKRLIAGLLLICSGYASAAEVAGNVTLGTDYRFRGISQTDRDPTVQGGFDYSWDNGIYVGTWASNIAFGGSMEWDFYGGFAGEFSDNVGYDLGYIYYAYPSDNSEPDLDYQEFYGKLGFYGAEVGLVYSDDYFGSTSSFYYIYGTYSIPLGEIFSLDLNLGWNKFKDQEAFGDFIGAVDPGDDYIDFGVGVSASWVGLDWSLAYIGTDIDNSDCADKICKPTGVLSVSKSL